MAKSATGYTKLQWETIRRHLRQVAEDRGGVKVLATELGIKANTLSSFLLGRSKGLSSETVQVLKDHGIMPELAGKAEPVPDFTGETRTTAEAAREKGVHPSTIRRWCHRGKVKHTRKGRRILVVVDDAYEGIKPREKARLLDRIEQLEKENARLRRQLGREKKTGQVISMAGRRLAAKVREAR